MSKISIYEVVPVPKLADKLVGTSVGGDPEDITYNFTLSELLNLFIPNIPGNTLQGVLDFGNTATQDINLTGIITTTTLNVGSTANILNSNLTGQTHITGGLYDRLNSIGTAGQVLTSTGTQVEWYTIPTVIPDLQQVLTSGNTAVNNIILTGNLSANNAALLTSTISTSLTVLGTLRDGLSSVGANNQVLSSNVTGVRWVNLPVYSATSPLLYNSGTGVFSIQQANASQNGYLSSADWITFDGKQTAISLTTTGNSGASTLVGATINVPNYTLSGLGGVPLTRTLTINGVTYNLAADRSWTLATGVSSVTATTPLSSTGGVNPDISIQQSSSSLDGYLSSTDWLTFNSKQPAGNYITSLTGEATAAGPGAASVTLSNAAVIGKLLTGLSITGSAISSSDSILTAFGKVQNQINGLIGGVQYQGVWNAATNTPALVSSVGTQGYYYIVSVAGNTNLNGITDWQVGDWAIFNGSTWNKVDNTDLVTSVNGQVGAVSLTTDNIPEGATNLYYLDSRARAALSFAAGSGAYNSTTGVITIPTDNSQILNGAGYITLVSLSATSPLSYNNITGAFSIQVANTTQNGYLSSTDWNTFNGKQDYLNGTGLVKSVAGVISYITDNSANWNTAYNDSIVSASVTGTATKTLTLNQQDGGTITASWSDIDTGLTSVGVSMPSAFTVTNSPLTSNGTIAITGSGNTLQYVDGTGALQSFPSLTGYVPYTGATANVNLGIYNLTAASLIKNGGTSGQFLKADGSVDSSAYIVLGSLSATAPLSYNNTTGVFTISQSGASTNGYLSSTDWNTFNSKEPAITAGTTLQYYRGDKTFQTLNTTVVPEGTNLYYLDSRARAAVSLTTVGSSGASTYNSTTGVFNIPDYGAALTGYVPTSRTLNINGTSYDLSADRSWSVGTVTSVAALTLGTTGTDLSSSVATGTTTPVITLNVPTASAANRGALSAADWSTFNTKVGGVTATSPLFSSGGSTPNITIQQSSGSQDGYLSSTDWTTFNNKQVAGNYITSLTGEATATGPGAAAVTLDNAAVTGKILTGVNITGGTVLATDTMLTAFGKLQNQVNGLIGGSIYQGTWNAATNTPTLTSSVGTQGYYYIVSVAGTTNLNGITDWFVGDWAIFNGGVWQQVDNTDAVVSVNGQTGAVSLTTDNISEGVTNLYYTDTRARAALSFVAGSGAYNSSTGAITIPTNTSQLTNGANFITLASLSGTAPISYNSGTGAISITQSGTASNGYLSSTDWNTFNNKQATLSLTTTGTSGAATLVGTTLNVPNYGSALTGYVPYTGATANVNLGIYSISAGNTSTFSNGSSLSAVFSNGGGVSNYNAIELRGGTAGTAVNWQISKDNTVANALQIFASTSVGGTTYTTSLFNLANSGYLTLANGLYTVNETRVANVGYLSSYNTSLRSIAGAIGILQLGNNNDNYILVGNTAVGGYLSIRVNVSAENAASGTEALRLANTGAATFYNNLTLSSASSTADLGGVLIVRGNGSAYTTHYLTTGAANVAAYYQYDAAGAIKTAIRAGDTSYFLGGNVGIGQAVPIYTLDVSGTGRFTGTTRVVGAELYLSSGNAITFDGAASGLNPYIYYNSGGNQMYIRNNTTSGTISIGNQNGTLAFNSAGAAVFSSRLNINGATDDADIALQTIAPSGAGKYIMVGRDSASQWRFSVASNGDTQIGAPQGASYKLLTLSSGGNNLDTGTVLRLVGGPSLDLVDISVADTKTRIYHQENAADAANGYGIVQFRTNAVGNATYPTRGGFQFTIEAADVLFINSIGQATFSNLAGTGTRMVVADANGLLSTQAIGSGAITGSGTTNYLPKFTGTSTIGNSLVQDNGSTVSISTGSTVLSIDRTGGATALLELKTGGTVRGYLGADASMPFVFFNQAASPLMRLDSSGNLGLGVTPSAWNSIYKVAEIGTAAIFGTSSYNSAAFSTNVFYNASNSPRYIANDFSNMYWQDDGNHIWYNAPSGIAGNAITFTQVMTLTAAGNLDFGNGSKIRMQNPSMMIDGLTPSYFGYSSGYGILLVGHPGLSNRSIAFGVDVTGNPSGAFSGNGSEYLWKNVGYFITPNSINNGYNTLLSWNSSGQINIPGATTIGSLTTASLQIGDYTGSPTLTFAALGNGLSKINFYDSNSTEGLYLRTDGEQYGGTMTFGARWDDDEAKIVFKMYQVSAGATYNARVGIGTTSPNSTLHVVGDNGSSTSAILRLRDTNATARTARLQFEDYNGTLADGLIDFVIPTAGSATGARLSLGVNSTILHIVNGGNVGIGSVNPSKPLSVISYVDDGAISSGGLLYTSGYFGTGGIVLGIVSGTGNAAIFNNSNKDILFGNWNGSTNAERMRISNTGNFDYGGFNVQSSNNSVYRQAFWGAMSIMWRNAEDFYIDSNHTYSSSNTNVATYTSGNGIGRLGIGGGNFEWLTYNGSVTAGSAYSLTTRFLINPSGNVAIGTTSAPGRLTVDYTSYSSGQTPLYVGNTGFTAWNRQSYDTFVLQQDDVTSFRMVEKNGETTTSDQVLSFSIGDGVGRIATSGQPLQFYVNGSPSGLAYQGLSGTQVLAMNTNGNAQFNYELGVTGNVSTGGSFISTVGGTAELRLRGGGYGGSYNTSLRSLAGAVSVLQFGNNGDNFVLIGNTAYSASTALYFRINTTTESTTGGSEILRLNNNLSAQFASSLTAASFFESSDSRIKTLIKDDYKVLGIESIKARLYLKDGKEEVGYYAQDFQSILPSAVTEGKDGILSLSYTQVHTAKIAIIEDEVTVLKRRVAELESKLN